MSAVRLTGWPPLATLFQALLAAAVLAPIVMWFAWVFVPIYTKDPSRVLIGGVLFGLLGLFLLLTFVRLAMRWIVRPSITVEDEHLVVRVRRRRFWLFDRMEEHRVRLADIRALRFETSHRTSFTIDTAAAQIALPPAMFAIGPHSLDAAIRAHVPHDRFPDPLAEVRSEEHTSELQSQS